MPEDSGDRRGQGEGQGHEKHPEPVPEQFAEVVPLREGDGFLSQGGAQDADPVAGEGEPADDRDHGRDDPEDPAPQRPGVPERKPGEAEQFVETEIAVRRGRGRRRRGHPLSLPQSTPLREKFRAGVSSMATDDVALAVELPAVERPSGPYGPRAREDDESRVC